VSDFARMGAENIPKWVWALLGIGTAIALIVLFATGVGEAAVVLAGVGVVAATIIRAVLRASGRAADQHPETAEAEGPDPDQEVV
jgi:hypothetical protein